MPRPRHFAQAPAIPSVSFGMLRAVINQESAPGRDSATWRSLGPSHIFGPPSDAPAIHPSPALTQLLDQVQNALGDVFRIENELTGGGMSRLFIAIESSLNRRVVIKVLPPEWASEVSAARFKREMEFAAQLQHPHILPVLAAGARDQLLYYIMPYVDGESIRARLKREGPFPIPDATRIIAEVADALAYAHQRGVIHRDIKPENILLEGRHAVLADFGVARAVLEARTGERLTSTGVAVGTPGYMSPEQVAGDQVDARADVYALAIVGYEIITGTPPFTGSSAQAILTAHLTEVPPPLDTIRKETPRRVSAAIARALSKNPDERFRTAAEFSDALHAEHGDGASRGISPETRRILLVVGVMIAVVLGGFAWMRSAASTSALLARATPAADSGRFDEVFGILDSAGATLGERRLSALATRVGGRLAIVTDPPGAEVTVTRVHPLDSLGARTPVRLGQTPVSPMLAVAGEYLVHLTHPAAEPMDLLLDVSLGTSLEVRRTLNTDSTRRGMSLVDAGPSPTGRTTPAFFIDRREVTNAEFQRFVAGGGYRDQRLWPDSMIIGGRTLARAAAIEKLVDRTGLPSPRFWSGARFAEGKGDHPVVGVSWYEAAAFARWAGKRLPTQDEWWRAALGAGEQPFPWGRDGATVDSRANFGLVGTTPVGAYPAGVSAYGCYDMAGNVREWLADTAPSDGRRHIVTGGSWQDPSYMFELAHSEHFDPSFASAALGFRLAQSVEAGARQDKNSSGEKQR
jgi:eukaryotic-like serine/threonine-protein kinase